MDKSRRYRFIGLAVFVILLIGVSLIGFITYSHQNLSPKSMFTLWALENHVSIMIAMIIFSAGFGFITSSITSNELKKRKKETKNILDILFLFLNKEEKSIIAFLIKKNGETNQAEISRLPNMNRVKAFRSLKRMEEKELIEIIPHGKIRKINLKKNILGLLTDNVSEKNKK